MMNRSMMGVGVLALALMTAAVRAEDKVELGKAVPDFCLKCTLSGEEVKLSAFKGKIVVVNFINYGCPVSVAYDNRLAKFAADYKEKGVVFLHIDSNKTNSVEDCKAKYEKCNLGCAVLKDEGAKVADIFAAEKTPHLFVIDKEGKLVYRGAFDDGKGKGFATVTKMYVKDAVEAVMSGSEVPTKETKAVGCSIKR